MAQSSAGDNASLETVSSALLDSPSFITTTSSLSIANSSLASNNSLSAQTVIMCKGASMGYELDARSCGYAIGTIQHHLAREFTWGPRGTEIRYDFPMPRRWVSCGLLTATLPVLSKSVQLTRSVADGTCVIQTRVLPGYTSAEASLQDVALGAIAVMTECVQKKTPSEGGLAKNIGGDNKLGLVVAKPYEAAKNVRCYGDVATMVIVNSCQNIMDKMDVSNSPRIFGIGAGVDVELPYIWHSDDHKCIMTITTSGPTDVSTWANMWEAATIATGMCSVQRKKGLYSHIGVSRMLYLEVAAEGAHDHETP
ncbi:MAG: hypothetical protein ASARMPREDX12_003424 [Alectoria sarmentosa]|nr:MAG: hypothetical protein ASARMPREDX12_003424 [Alectoria sarmentosa]